jgi:uncharacterized protein (DUF1015 family)
MIADGHHRYATYLQHQAERRAAGAGPGPWDYGLALLVDSSAFGPRVHAIHRVVSGLSLAAAAGRAEGGFAVRRLEETAASEALHTLAQAGKSGPAFLLSDGREYVLLAEPRAEVLDEVLPAERSAAWRQLDVTVAHHMLIRALWGLSDDEQTVGYQHDVDSALAAARDGGAVALLLNPTPLDSVVAVAAAGERMPRKSTLFTPKPASGLLMRVFADQD